ncbi:MAG: hypothetical protein R6U61_09365 [Thermoplasmata archaeon]
MSSDEFRKSEEWLKHHYKELREKYSGKILAVIGPDQYLVKNNYDDLVKGLEKKGIDFDSVAVTHIPRKGQAAIV